MAHVVWNLGELTASGRSQPRQFVGGIAPAQNVVIGRAREPKPMLLLEDAWLELNDFTHDLSVDFHQAKFSLALGKDPLNDALLLPVGAIRDQGIDPGVGATDQPAAASAPIVEQLFQAQGTMWAALYIAIDFQESGVVTVDADVHLDVSTGFVDWWTWFVAWNDLEVSPDGMLVDGERAYG